MKQDDEWDVESYVDNENHVSNPWRFGLRNSVLATIPVGISLAIYCWRFWGLLPFATWWHFVIVFAALPVVCFSHAFVAHAIGRKKADLIFVIPLLALPAGGVYWLTHRN